MEGKQFKGEIVEEDLDAVVGMSEEDTFSPGKFAGYSSTF